MRMITSLAAAALTAAAAQPTAALTIRQQAPCPVTGTACVTFDSNDAIPDVRTYAFTPTVDGAAVFVFNGSMYCVSAVREDRTVSFDAQIVAGPPTTRPDRFGPGGFQFGGVISSSPDHTSAGADSYSLNAMRVLQVRKGVPRRVTFRIAKNRMDSDLSCYVESHAAFVVIAD